MLYALYGDMSHRVMETLRDLAPIVDVYSIDESFLDVTDIQLDGFPQRIRQTVKQWTGIPVSVGIGMSKTLAKVANRLAKKKTEFSGSLDFVSRPELIDPLLEQMAVENVWGIGKASATKLGRHGIVTALQLRDSSIDIVRREMGVVGVRIVYELRGESCIPLDLASQPRKSIVSSRSFGRPVEKIEEIQEAVAYHVDVGARKLRRQGSVAGIISVFFHTSRFRDGPGYSAHVTTRLPVPCACTVEMTGYAMRAVQSAFKAGFLYAKAGVMWDDICEVGSVQGNLFDHVDRGRSKQLMTVMDRINDAMGDGTLRSGASGFGRGWKTKFQNRTPCYTTRWADLVRVRA